MQNTVKYDSNHLTLAVANGSHNLALDLSKQWENRMPSHRKLPAQEEEVFRSADNDAELVADNDDGMDEMWLPVTDEMLQFNPPQLLDDFLLLELDFGKQLSAGQKEKFLEPLKAYPATFPTKDNQLKYCPLIEHRIKTGDAKPIKEPF